MTKAIYRRIPVIENEAAPNLTWCGESRQMLNITHDSESYRTSKDLRDLSAIPMPSGDFVIEKTGQRWLRLYCANYQIVR